MTQSEIFRTVVLAQPQCSSPCPTPMLQVGPVAVVVLLCTKEKGHEGKHAYVQEWEANSE